MHTDGGHYPEISGYSLTRADGATFTMGFTGTCSGCDSETKTITVGRIIGFKLWYYAAVNNPPNDIRYYLYGMSLILDSCMPEHNQFPMSISVGQSNSVRLYKHASLEDYQSDC